MTVKTFENCSHCKGKGRVGTFPIKCPICNGAKTLPSFEEKFPELKSWFNRDLDISVPRVTLPMFSGQQIEAHCLSKYRVKKAIEKILKDCEHDKILLKELGLEEEDGI